MKEMSARLVAAAIAVLTLTAGCSPQNVSFIDPQGPIASAQRWHLIKVTAIAMIAVQVFHRGPIRRAVQYKQITTNADSHAGNGGPASAAAATRQAREASS